MLKSKGWAGITIPVEQTERWRPRKGKGHAQGHTGSPRQSQTQNWDFLPLRPVNFQGFGALDGTRQELSHCTLCDLGTRMWPWPKAWLLFWAVVSKVHAAHKEIIGSRVPGGSEGCRDGIIPGQVLQTQLSSSQSNVMPLFPPLVLYPLGIRH